MTLKMATATNHSEASRVAGRSAIKSAGGRTFRGFAVLTSENLCEVRWG